MDFKLNVSNEVYGKIKMNTKSDLMMSMNNGIVVNTLHSKNDNVSNKVHKHSTEDYDIEIIHGATSVLFATAKKSKDITIYIQGKEDLDIHKFSKVMVTYKGDDIYELKASLNIGQKVHILYSNSPFVFLDAIPQDTSNSSFRILYKMLGNHDSQDRAIVEDVINRWSRIITGPIFPNDNCELSVKIEFKDLGNNVLGSAVPTNFRKYQNHYIPCEGEVSLNIRNWKEQRTQIKKDGKTNAYYTLLHEFGHVLGIGTYWRAPDDNQPRANLLDVRYKEIIDGYPVYTRYIGQNALAKYKDTMNNQSLSFIPIEDDGGAGTYGGHAEEGEETSNGIKYHDGHSHPGLDRELMTGISEIDDEPEILSSITVGFLHDIGFDVKYEESDDGTYPLWADKNNLTVGYLNKGETLQADIYVNGKVFHKYLTNQNSSNIQNILLNLNYGSGMTKVVLHVNGKVILYSYDIMYDNGKSDVIEVIDGEHERIIDTYNPFVIDFDKNMNISNVNFHLKGSIL